MHWHDFCIPKWLVGHSFLERATLYVNWTILHEFAPSYSIWEPYSSDVIDGCPTYYVFGMYIWRYRGPMVGIFIVESHFPDRVTRHGILQSIQTNALYLSDHHKMTLKKILIINWIEKHQPNITICNTCLDHIF